jgi:hypothetical protein
MYVRGTSAVDCTETTTTGLSAFLAVVVLYPTPI